MMRWLLWIVGGVLLGGIVHLGTVLMRPSMAAQDAFARLSARTPVNAVTALTAPAPDSAVMPFMDPAFVAAACRYDLSNGAMKLSVPISAAYTSVSFYTRYGISYYAINDRAAGRRVIELDLMTADQRAELPEDEEITAADRLIVESPTPTGVIVMRALAPEPGLMPMAQRALTGARCGPAEAPTPLPPPPRPAGPARR